MWMRCVADFLPLAERNRIYVYRCVYLPFFYDFFWFGNNSFLYIYLAEPHNLLLLSADGVNNVEF